MSWKKQMTCRCMQIGSWLEIPGEKPHDIYDFLDSQGDSSCGPDLFLGPRIGSEMTSHRCETRKDIFRSFVSPQKTNMTMDKSQATIWVFVISPIITKMVGFFQLVILVFQFFFSSPLLGNLFGRRISSSTAVQGHLETSREQSGTLRLLAAERARRVGCGWVWLVVKIQHASHHNVQNMVALYGSISVSNNNMVQIRGENNSCLRQ